MGITRKFTIGLSFHFESLLVLPLKCPYYGLWMVHILVLGVPYNRLTCMQGQKTLSFSYNMHLFLPYLLNDSQTIRSMINFYKPLLCVTLICGDWSDWSISFKAVFVSSVLLCVQPLPGKQLFLRLQKRHLVAKNEFAFSFRPTLTSTWNGLVFVLKTTRFSDSESTLSFERQYKCIIHSFIQ